MRGGVEIREFPLSTGEADYLLAIDGEAVGVVEAKKTGTTLSGVKEQSALYQLGLPQGNRQIRFPRSPLKPAPAPEYRVLSPQVNELARKI